MAAHARARPIQSTVEGRVSGSGAAAVDARERRLPPESRDGASRGAGRLRDREPRPPRTGRSTALLGAAVVALEHEAGPLRSEEHTPEMQPPCHLVCRPPPE